MKKSLAALLAASVSLCFGQAGVAADEKPAIKVGALFSVTGPSSFLGGPEARISQMLVDEINSKGGVSGHKIELVIKDTLGEPEKAISFAKQLIEEEQVFAIIGPSTTGESLKIKKLCQDNKTILISCAAAEAIVEPLLPYVFKTPQKDSYAARKIFMRLKEMGLTKVGIVSDNTGFGAGGKDQLEKYAPEFGMTIVGNEVYDKGDTDLTAVATKIKASGAQAVVNWSVVPAQSIVMKNFRQVGFKGPLFQSH
ncbi:MAG: ABC transporter substrate-binding protein, partial [Lentisphaerae bacterium]|nr:ABC transporter substrate-binding protein [Lentisphaerota bacterium]